MSEKKLKLIQRFLVAGVLILLCVALVLGILLYFKQNKNPLATPSLKPTQTILEQNLTQQNLEIQDEVFVDLQENNISSSNNISQNFIEENLTETNTSQKISVLERIFEQNLTQTEQNLTLIKDENLTQILTKEQNLTPASKVSRQQKTLEKENLTQKKNTPTFSHKDPKLAIIIDDMSNLEQVKALKKLKLKIIPSFFPPDNIHKNTPRLADKFEFYMVHLPLEALKYESKLDTLNPKDTQKRIDKKIAKIKREFNNVKFINNHTGSLFTSDLEAMRKLYHALVKENFIFVDSRTVYDSKVKQAALEFNQIYIQRDVFLDNEDDITYIKNQLKEAIKIAQKRGFAIAIAHPKQNTFKALEQSKDLLKSVKLVYLSEIYGK